MARIDSFFLCVAMLIACATMAYCQNCYYAKFTPQHSGCKKPNPQCQFLQRGLSARDRDLIVRAHNKYRQKVANGQEGRGAPGPQPRAANMKQLVWDDELAFIVQAHTDQCRFQHDCGDCRKVDRFGVGQNLYQSSTTGQISVNVEDAVRAWYDEVAKFDGRKVGRYEFTSATGHYSQLVWANSYRVGCSLTVYKDGNWKNAFIGCNYGPAGNFIGQEVYRQGNACSACPRGCSSQFPGLCN